MTNAMTPIFEMQRTVIEQNRKTLTDGVEAQKAAFETFTDGLESSQSLAERNVELSQSMLHAYIDAVENTVPEDAADFEDLRGSVDEGFEALTENQADAWDSVLEIVEESGATYEELADAYVEAVDSSFDAFLQSHEQIEASVDSAAEGVDVPVQAD